MKEHSYPGGELELFAAAEQWKAYWASQISPFVRGRVLEVGAGIGSNTLALGNLQRHGWICLEPDRSLAERLREAVHTAALTPPVEVVIGTIADLERTPCFDSILYIDVLEHIDNDRGELLRAAELLRPGGHLIVLAPAHQFLYSAFDKAIGHYRRYSRRHLLGVAPPTVSLRRAVYLDSVGLVASLTNRSVLSQSLPTAAQIRFWDRRIIPVSTVLDRLLNFACGKSVLVVWTKTT